MRVVMVFVDGVGIGTADAEVNPFARAQLHTLHQLLGSPAPLFDASPHAALSATLVPLDATLGVPGLPQSGTGQTALFTGINAAAEFGRHFGPWVPTALRDRLAQQNLLTRARSAGRAVAFANAYPEELFVGGADPRARDRESGPVADPLRAGPPIAALGAGVLNRHTPHLARGDAVASEITNEGWRTHLRRAELPVISAVEAGRNLARIAAHHDVTLFAHYTTDFIGHTGQMQEAMHALQVVDEFLSGLIAAVSRDTLIALVSDHGNIEDVRVGHTMNPALGLFVGADHARFARGVDSVTDVAPVLIELLGIADHA